MVAVGLIVAIEKYGLYALQPGLPVVIGADSSALRGPSYALHTAEVNTHSCTLDASITRGQHQSLGDIRRCSVTCCDHLFL